MLDASQRPRGWRRRICRHPNHVLLFFRSCARLSGRLQGVPVSQRPASVCLRTTRVSLFVNDVRLYTCKRCAIRRVSICSRSDGDTPSVADSARESYVIKGVEAPSDWSLQGHLSLHPQQPRKRFLVLLARVGRVIDPRGTAGTDARRAWFVAACAELLRQEACAV